MFSCGEVKVMTGMDTAEHLAVNQIKGAGLCCLPDGVVMAVTGLCRLGMNSGLSMRRHARMRQCMRQRTMLRRQQQSNQRAAQPLRAQSQTQQTGHVR